MGVEDEWEVEEFVLHSMAGEVARWYEKTCRHARIEPVESGGELVAKLCLTCDEQLPAEWS